MKIAVLLRGQPRFSDYGADLFRKFVQDRFPEHEFDIFIATWKTISNTMEKTIDPDAVVYGREYDQTLLEIDETIDLIKKWRPKRFDVTFEKELFDLLKTIYIELVSDVEKYEALRELLDEEDGKEPLNGKNVLVPGYTNVFESKEYLITNLIWGNKIELSESAYELKRNMINNQYLFGQVYSAGKSYEAFEIYCKDNNYTADLVWSTRQDMIHWFNRAESFDVIKKDLERLEGEQKFPHMMVDKIEVQKGRPWVSDYNFYMLPETADHIFSDIKGKFKEWILEDTLSLLPAIGSGSVLQHVLWTSFYRNCNMVALNPYTKPAHSTVIRPVKNIEKIVKDTLNSPTTIETVIKFLKDTSNKYPYPNANAPVPPELIDSYYEILSNN